jgi:hypothetical protein
MVFTCSKSKECLEITDTQNGTLSMMWNRLYDTDERLYHTKGGTRKPSASPRDAVEALGVFYGRNVKFPG